VLGLIPYLKQVVAGQYEASGVPNLVVKTYLFVGHKRQKDHGLIGIE
jgi:hypothetical protein